MTGQDLRTALTDASRVGGCVDIPPGMIEIPSDFAIPPNVWMRGAGPSTILRPAPTFTAPALLALDTGNGGRGVVRVSDLTIDGQGQDVIGLWLSALDPGSSVERVVVRDTIRSGILIGSILHRANGVRVADNQLRNCGSLTSTMDFMGIAVVHAVDVQIQGNQVIDSPIAIHCEMHPGYDDVLMNIQISGNLVRTQYAYPTHWGVGVLGRADRAAAWISVTGNHCLGPAGAPWLHTEHVTSFTEAGNVVY